MARHFGRNLFRRRRWAGYSQEEVAERTGLHRTEIGTLEGGTACPASTR
ncbi:MAG: helix-turn-helix transcriptional regulator [Solirubrobacterales bacterium]